MNEWCEGNGVPKRPIVSLGQLWRLSVAWYENRLSPDARRPQADEIRRIFEGIGLTGPFWDPQADEFG
ncbi:MAG TPA: hypothetical protein VIY96_05225 [Thermoanaerobaculia bacterium]